MLRYANEARFKWFWRIFKKKLQKFYEKIYKKFTKNLQKFYKKFIKNLQKIYKKFTKNLQKIYKNVSPYANEGFVIFLQSQAKFSMERAREALDWVEAVLDRALPFPKPEEGLRDQLDFSHVLRDGVVLCE